MLKPSANRTNPTPGEESDNLREAKVEKHNSIPANHQAATDHQKAIAVN